MKIAWRKIAVAGVLGFTGGHAVSRLRNHGDVVIPILQVSAVSGIAGALVGWRISAYRNVPSHIHSLSLATNFAIVSGAFLGIRTLVQSTLVEETIPHKHHHHHHHHTTTTIQYISSMTSGGLTGALTSIISRYGLRSMFLTSLGGMGIGLCVQGGYNGVMEWRRRKAIELYYHDMGRGKKGRFEKWTFDNFEARFLGFWHKQSESIQVETDILSLETGIEEEKRKIARLDKMLAEKGLNDLEIVFGSDTTNCELAVGNSVASL